VTDDSCLLLVTGLLADTLSHRLPTCGLVNLQSQTSQLADVVASYA